MGKTMIMSSSQFKGNCNIIFEKIPSHYPGFLPNLTKPAPRAKTCVIV